MISVKKAMRRKEFSRVGSDQSGKRGKKEKEEEEEEEEEEKHISLYRHIRLYGPWVGDSFTTSSCRGRS